MSTPENQLSILANDIQKTREAVIRMEGKLDNVIDKVKDHAGTLDDHEARLRELEKARWPLAQIGVVLSFLAMVAAFVSIFFV